MSETHTAVILARGLGTRMRRGDGAATLSAQQQAVAQTGVKAMIPIGRPFLDYVLSALADAGCRRTVLVIGPEHQAVRNYYGRPWARMMVDFAIQAEPRGTADAVAAAAQAVGDEPFLVLNSDNYYPQAALAGLCKLRGPGLAAFEREALLAGGNIPAPRVQAFAILHRAADGCLRRIVEKPTRAEVVQAGEPVYVSMNCWRLDARIFEACRRIEFSPRGELELTSAVQYAIDSLGVRFETLPVREGVLDLSSQNDIAAVQQRLAGVEVRL